MPGTDEDARVKAAEGKQRVGDIRREAEFLLQLAARLRRQRVGKIQVRLAGGDPVPMGVRQRAGRVLTRLGKDQRHRLCQRLHVLTRMLDLALDELRFSRHMVGEPPLRLLARKALHEARGGFSQKVTPLLHLFAGQHHADAHDQQKADERQDAARKGDQPYPLPYVQLHLQIHPFLPAANRAISAAA